MPMFSMPRKIALPLFTGIILALALICFIMRFALNPYTLSGMKDGSASKSSYRYYLRAKYNMGGCSTFSEWSQALLALVFYWPVLVLAAIMFVFPFIGKDKLFCMSSRVAMLIIGIVGVVGGFIMPWNANYIAAKVHFKAAKATLKDLGLPVEDTSMRPNGKRKPDIVIDASGLKLKDKLPGSLSDFGNMLGTGAKLLGQIPADVKLPASANQKKQYEDERDGYADVLSGFGNALKDASKLKQRRRLVDEEEALTSRHDAEIYTDLTFKFFIWWLYLVDYIFCILIGAGVIGLTDSRTEGEEAPGPGYV